MVGNQDRWREDIFVACPLSRLIPDDHLLKRVDQVLDLSWLRDEVDGRLQDIMKSIHQSCVDAAAEYGTPGNYVNGANIGGFLKVADAMIDQGVV